MQSRSKQIRRRKMQQGNVKYSIISVHCSSSETSENDGTDDETETNSNIGSRRTNQTDTIQNARLVMDNQSPDGVGSGNSDGNDVGSVGNNGDNYGGDDGSGNYDGDEHEHDAVETNDIEGYFVGILYRN